MNKDLETIVLEAKTDNPIEVVAYLKNKYNLHVKLQQVRSILSSQEARQNNIQARDTAASGMSSRVDKLEFIEQDLYDAYTRETSVEGKLKIARELRNWIKQGSEIAGIYDNETNIMWAIPDSWQT